MRRVNKGQVPARRQARHFTTLDCSRRRRCALIPGFDAVGGSEASFQEWEHTQPVEGQGFLQAIPRGSLRQTDSSASVRV